MFAEKLAAAQIVFKQQMILGFYILDFVLPDPMVCIEIDGAGHASRQGYDERRDQFVTNLGFLVHRIPNAQVESYDAAGIRHLPTFREWAFKRALSRASIHRGLKVSRHSMARPWRPVTRERLLADQDAILA